MVADAERHAAVYEWLTTAEADRRLGGGQRRYALLRYLVGEELDGRGGALKAYAIGVDVLGRGTSFDPSTDSIVRVEVARLRDALELYYARSQARGEPVISIPKGSYRPQIVLAESPPRRASAPGGRLPVALERGPALAAALGAGALALACAAAAAIWFNGLRPPAPPPSATPILQMARLGPDHSTDAHFFALGFRQHLLSDLAHLPTIIVRDGPIDPDALRSADILPPDYILAVIPVFEGDTGIIGLQLTAARDATVLWAKTIAVSDHGSDFYSSLLAAVEGVGQEIAGPLGAITTQEARETLAARSTQSEITGEEYSCLVVSLVFDATKDSQAGALSRQCLSTAIANGSRSAPLLSSHALNLFFTAAHPDNAKDRRRILEQARGYAARALEANPRDSFSFEVMGNITSALDEPAAAIAHYARAAELAPSRPAPHFLLGWQTALAGDWEAGVAAMQAGIDMQPNVPGYMIIPLALDAFRRANYALSLDRAQAVIDRGDRRGYALAFAASVALGDLVAADSYFNAPAARTSHDPADPMREVRVTFSNPDVMPKYETIIAPYLAELSP